MSGEWKKRRGSLLYGLRRFVCFFLVVGLIVTCCTMLFVTRLQKAAGLVFTEENIRQAARLTFLNVLALTAAFAVVDRIRRRYMVNRPVRLIIGTAQKLMRGDFSARVPRLRTIDAMDGFTEIGECINRLAEELSGTETLRTDFIANVSHELKTPLAVISNYAAMLAGPELPEARRVEYADAILETSRRLASLITNILKLNKLENQQIFPQSERFDLGEQLCECLLSFEDAWEKKGIDICTDIEEDVRICGDAELLSMVWNNLFSNAIKFTGEGGRVTLRMFSEGDSATVQVSDTGCGFGGEVGRHIFEKFYQGDASHATQGNGLGLALVKRVVDIVGGGISVNSEWARGAPSPCGSGGICVNRLKRFLARVVFLPGWLTALIAIPSFALVIYVLASGLDASPLAYVSYAASAYALLVVAVSVPDLADAMRRFAADHPLVRRVRESRQGRRFLAEPAYRAELALYAGLAVNLAYAALKMVSGIVFHSVWFGAMAAYYLFLSAMRFALLHHTRRSPVGRDHLSEWRRYRLCGVLLLMMNQALLCVVALVVYRNGGVEYPGYLIYVMAMYAFYAVISAVRNIVRFRACVSPVLSAAKSVSLAAAMVSLLSLETAMLSQFGSAEEAVFRRRMTGWTGVGVCAIVLLMAVYMIVRSTGEIRRMKRGVCEK